jgi:hypothetical protein
VSRNVVSFVALGTTRWDFMSKALPPSLEGPPQVWGSGGDRLRMRVCIVGWVEFLSVAGTKPAIVDRAANPEQEIGPSSRPAHLLGF